ncbi:MAG: YihY/virulence factor BrkB family protein [Actinomycetota bacterium]|nr:YihY/virulence factor BrkB family protein [Actinomycetota bacterium]
MANMKALLERFDGYQQQHRWLAIPLAVAKKFSDDKAGYLAALVAYYAFFSLFPLLLVLVTALGFFLGRNSEFQQRVVNSVLTQFPIIGDQIRENIQSIRGSGVALAIGIAGTLLAGLAVIQALQHGMDEIWNVPVSERPNFLISKLRSLLMLLVLGGGAIGATLVSGIAAGGSGGVWSIPLRFAGFIGSLALNFGLFMVAFRVLTVAPISWRDVWKGALFAAVAWALLQHLGSFYVSRQLRNAGQVYGFFAIVIGLLSWLYVGAQLTLLAAETNVVLARRLWPRSLSKQGDVTHAETRALSGLAEQEQRHPRESIDVSFGGKTTSGS